MSGKEAEVTADDYTMEPELLDDLPVPGEESESELEAHEAEDAEEEKEEGAPEGAPADEEAEDPEIAELEALVAKGNKAAEKALERLVADMEAEEAAAAEAQAAKKAPATEADPSVDPMKEWEWEISSAESQNQTQYEQLLPEYRGLEQTGLKLIAEQKKTERLLRDAIQRGLDADVVEAHQGKLSVLAERYQDVHARWSEKGKQIQELGTTARGIKVIQAELARGPEFQANPRLYAELRATGKIPNGTGYREAVRIFREHHVNPSAPVGQQPVDGARKAKLKRLGLKMKGGGERAGGAARPAAPEKKVKDVSPRLTAWEKKYDTAGGKK